MRVIVVGLGIVGSAAAYCLARRGVAVTAVDAHVRGHSLGSSHGTTRMTRLAYYESPDYVPLLRRSLEIWQELEAESGQALTLLKGGLYLGAGDCDLISGSLRSARQHGIAHELMTAAEIRSRFPAFCLPADFVGLYEKNTAGILFAEKMVQTCRDLAVRHGASLNFERAVTSWHATASGVKVDFAGGSLEADALVMAAGPWLPEIMRAAALPLRVVRVWTSYFNAQTAARFVADCLPIYCLHDTDGFFYGFPHEEGKGMKVGCHRSDMLTDDRPDLAAVTPQSCDRAVSQEEIATLQEKLQQYLPGAAHSHASSSTCLYTMTPDEHFIVDRLPEAPQVVYASACSGHGFKFGSVLGEVLADLAVEGTSKHCIEFLSAKRFACRLPASNAPLGLPTAQ